MLPAGCGAGEPGERQSPGGRLSAGVPDDELAAGPEQAEQLRQHGVVVGRRRAHHPGQRPVEAGRGVTGCGASAESGVTGSDSIQMDVQKRGTMTQSVKKDQLLVLKNKFSLCVLNGRIFHIRSHAKRYLLHTSQVTISTT